MKTINHVIPVWLKAFVACLAVSVPALFVTSALLGLNLEYPLGNLPWGLLPIIVVLALYWRIATGEKLGFIKASQTRKSLSNAFALKKNQHGWIALACIAFVVMYITLVCAWIMLGNFETLHMIENANQVKTLSPILAFGVILSVSLPAGIVEEIGFRGYFQTMMTRRYTLWASIVFIAIIFAAIHRLPLILFPPYILVSIGFSLITHYVGSVKPAVIAHVAIDICLLSLAYLFHEPFMNIVSYNVFTDGIPVGFVVCLAASIASGALFCYTLVRQIGGKMNSANTPTAQMAY